QMIEILVEKNHLEEEWNKLWL
ncbi:3-deoxy-D-manno-octulosonate 8-phosphate phosphatase, partial [Campylobacter jejuni]